MHDAARSTGPAPPPAPSTPIGHLCPHGPASGNKPRPPARPGAALTKRGRDARDGRVSLIANGAQAREALGRRHAGRIGAIAAAPDPQDRQRPGQAIPILECVAQALHVPATAFPAGKRKEAEG